MEKRFIDVMGMRVSRPAKTQYITGLDMSLVQTDEHILDKTKYLVESAIVILHYLIDSTRSDLIRAVVPIAWISGKSTARLWR